MVYLFAVTDHQKYQVISRFYPDHSLQTSLQEFLDDTPNINLIAEEYNEDAFGYGYTETVCQSVSNEYGIEHRFVEMDDATRYARGGIETKDFDVREEYWLSKIQDILDGDGDIVFILGRAHIDSFSALLSEDSNKSEVVSIIGEE
ncbi:MAG: hypothetical protein OCC46_09160 [Pseudodesulfovibrio sp.]